jgi:hypothetical protein
LKISTAERSSKGKAPFAPASENQIPTSSTTSGPVAPGRGKAHLIGRAKVPFADHVGVPTPLAEDLGQHPVLRWDHAAPVREANCRFGDARHAVPGVIAAGKEGMSG